MVEMEVLGIRVELPARQPILLLRAVHQSVCVPIWIGVQEANAIVVALQQIETPRPLTHQLLLQVIDHFEGTLERVEITGLEGHTYLGELVFSDDRRLSCRPSDGVALALNAGVPILASEELVETAGVEMDPEDVADEDSAVEEFREFLDHVSAEDFEGGPEGETGPEES